MNENERDDGVMTVEQYTATVEAEAEREAKREQFDLHAQEAIINDGIGQVNAAGVKVGNALARIRDGEMWRADGYLSWSAYLEQRWDRDRTYATRLIDFAQTYEALVPIGTDYLPQNEGQAREIKALLDGPWAPDEVAKIMAVVAILHGRITAAAIKAVASELDGAAFGRRKPETLAKEVTAKREKAAKAKAAAAEQAKAEQKAREEAAEALRKQNAQDALDAMVARMKAENPAGTPGFVPVIVGEVEPEDEFEDDEPEEASPTWRGFGDEPMLALDLLASMVDEWWVGHLPTHYTYGHEVLTKQLERLGASIIATLDAIDKAASA